MGRAEIVKAWNQAWSRGDTEKAFSLLSDDVVDHDIPVGRKFKGKKAMTRYWGAFAEAFPGYAVKNLRLHEAGRFVISEQLWTGIHRKRFPYWTNARPTNKKILFRIALFYEVSGDKIRSITEYYDRACILRQIGLLKR